MGRKRKYPKGTDATSVKFDPEFKEMLERIARAKQINLSDLVKQMLAEVYPKYLEWYADHVEALRTRLAPKVRSKRILESFPEEDRELALKLYGAARAYDSDAARHKVMEMLGNKKSVTFQRLVASVLAILRDEDELDAQIIKDETIPF